jgi:hypothetical protein
MNAETKPATAEQVMSNPPTQPEYILREWIRSEFNLPASIAAKLDTYYLRVWEGAHVLSRIQDGKMDGVYIVHFQSLPSVIRECKRVACSFRSYKDLQYVVVRVWKEEE